MSGTTTTTANGIRINSAENADVNSKARRLAAALERDDDRVCKVLVHSTGNVSVALVDMSGSLIPPDGWSIYSVRVGSRTWATLREDGR